MASLDDKEGELTMHAQSTRCDEGGSWCAICYIRRHHSTDLHADHLESSVTQERERTTQT